MPVAKLADLRRYRFEPDLELRSIPTLWGDHLYYKVRDDNPARRGERIRNHEAALRMNERKQASQTRCSERSN